MRLRKKVKNNRKPGTEKKAGGGFKKYFVTYIYIVAVAVVVPAVGYAGYSAYKYFFYKEKVFILKKVDVSGKGLTGSEKNAIIKQSGLFRNENMVNVDLKRVSRLIASDRWIKDVTVYKKYPDGIVIFVRKRKVVAMVADNGKLYYVGKNGYAISEADYENGYGYPVITGLNAGNDSGYFKGLKEALRFLNLSEPSAIAGKISEIHVQKDGGIAVYTDGGLAIKFGTGRYREKFKTLQNLFYEIKALNIKYRPYINLEYKNEAVIKVNPGSRVVPANYKKSAISSNVFK